MAVVVCWKQICDSVRKVCVLEEDFKNFKNFKKGSMLGKGVGALKSGEL